MAIVHVAGRRLQRRQLISCKNLLKEIPHGDPRASISLFVVNSRWRAILRHQPIREGVERFPVGDELPIHLGIAHLLPERHCLIVRHHRIVDSVQHQDLAFVGIWLERRPSRAISSTVMPPKQ